MRCTPLLAIVLLAGCTLAEPSTETFSWTGPVASETWMRLRNVNGDFDIREGTGDSAVVSMEIKRSSRFAPTVQIKVLQVADGILACVLYGNNNKCSADEYSGGNTYKKGLLPFLGGNANVTGTITLPRGVKLDAESTSGDITINGATNDIVVTTVNGDIEAHGVQRAASITTTNGDIDLKVDALGGKLNVTTTNGDVDLALPTALNAALAMHTTNGELRLGFPANVTQKSARLLVATFGSGGTPIDITTTNGDVSLSQQSERTSSAVTPGVSVPMTKSSAVAQISSVRSKP
jgi:Putative adhesin